MRLPTFAAIAVLLTSPAIAADLGGTYRVKGTNFDGSPYGGTAVITPTGGATCRIEWKTGGTSSAGICMLAGSAVSAAYRMGDAVGLVLYKLEADGTLEGVWTIADKKGSGTETLSPAK